MVSSDASTGPVGMRILVAANKPSATKSAAKFLGIRNSVVTCTSPSKLLGLLRRKSFDFVVAEGDLNADSKSPTVNGLALIDVDYAPPVVVAMDHTDEDAAATAMQRGAAGVIGLPLCKQEAALAAVWQNSLAERVKLSETSKSSSDSTDLEFPELLSIEDTVQDYIFSLDDLELEPMDYDAKPEAAGGDPLMTMTGTLLQASAAASGGSSMEENLTIAEAFGTDEAVSTMMPRSRSCTGTELRASDNKRPRSEVSKDETCSDDAYVKSEVVSDEISSDLSGFEDESCNDKLKASKKVKVEWTRELHDKFVKAVETLGADKAVPSRILEFMGTDNPGLTRQNIASHLQKYRHRSRGRGFDIPSSVKAPSGTTGPVVQTFLPVQPSSVPAPAAPGTPRNGLAINPAGPGSDARGPRSSTPPQQWLHPAVPIWSPWQGAVVYNHLGQPLVPQSLPVAHTFHVPTTTHVQAPQELQKAIKDMLSQPKAKAPLGLKLDRAGMLEDLKAAGKGSAVGPSAPGAPVPAAVGAPVA